MWQCGASAAMVATEIVIDIEYIGEQGLGGSEVIKKKREGGGGESIVQFRGEEIRDRERVWFWDKSMLAGLPLLKLNVLDLLLLVASV